MAIITNFGMSHSFAVVDLAGLGKLLPATMRVDFIRVYQDEGKEITTCDPPGYPTTDYIRRHGKVYNNPNATTWWVLLEGV